MYMVYYPYGNGPRYQMNSQRNGSAVPNRRQDEAYFYPSEMARQYEGYYNPYQVRRQDEYYPNPTRGRGEGYIYPDHRRRQEEVYYYQNQMRRQDEAYFHPNGMPGPNQAPMAGPNQAPMPGPNQAPNRRPPSRLPEQLNSIAGHMGTITQGINIMRQVGSLLSMFGGRR